MINDIQEHHSEEEVLKMSMEQEVKIWRKEIEFFTSEIEFYLDFLGSSLIEKTHSESMDARFLFKEFQDLRENNKLYLATCKQFQSQLPGMQECDDIQCDHAYIRSYLLFKNKMEKHSQDLRQIKESAFHYLKAGIERYRVINSE